jgi:hypothetical protein
LRGDQIKLNAWVLWDGAVVTLTGQRPLISVNIVRMILRPLAEKRMPITNQDELDGLKHIGHIVASTMPDTGATFRIGSVRASLDRLCRDGRRAMQTGIAQVRHDKPLAGTGNAIGRFAAERGYTLIRNLASHGFGRALQS